MEIKGFSPPDYGLIEANPEAFRQQVQALMDAQAAQQAEAGELLQHNEALHAALATAAAQLQEQQQAAAQQREAMTAITARHGIAVAAYRQAKLDGDPSLPPDLVQGQTIEEIDAALTKARAVVDYIRAKIATPGGAGLPGETSTAPTPPPRVPAGAPGRTLPDTSSMTAREKLIFGTSRIG